MLRRTPDQPPAPGEVEHLQANLTVNAIQIFDQKVCDEGTTAGLVRRSDVRNRRIRYWNGSEWTAGVAQHGTEASEMARKAHAQRLKRRAAFSLVILVSWWIVVLIIRHLVGTNGSNQEFVLYLVVGGIEFALIWNFLIRWWMYLRKRRR
jgi:hypothetical protein